MVDLYREAAGRAGHDADTLPVSINAHGFLAEDARTAADIAFPPFAETMTRIGRERGWPPTTRGQFEAEIALQRRALRGEPAEVVDKILRQHELFRHRALPGPAHRRAHAPRSGAARHRAAGGGGGAPSSAESWASSPRLPSSSAARSNSVGRTWIT